MYGAIQVKTLIIETAECFFADFNSFQMVALTWNFVKVSVCCDSRKKSFLVAMKIQFIFYCHSAYTLGNFLVFCGLINCIAIYVFYTPKAVHLGFECNEFFNFPLTPGF